MLTISRVQLKERIFQAITANEGKLTSKALANLLGVEMKDIRVCITMLTCTHRIERLRTFGYSGIVFVYRTVKQ